MVTAAVFSATVVLSLVFSTKVACRCQEKSSQTPSNRLWPKGALHPPNRVHSALFRTIIKPSFIISSIGNEIRKSISKILDLFKNK